MYIRASTGVRGSSGFTGRLGVEEALQGWRASCRRGVTVMLPVAYTMLRVCDCFCPQCVKKGVVV